MTDPELEIERAAAAAWDRFTSDTDPKLAPKATPRELFMLGFCAGVSWSCDIMDGAVKLARGRQP